MNKADLKIERYRSPEENLNSAGCGCRIEMLRYGITLNSHNFNDYNSNKYYLLSMINKMCGETKSATQADKDNYAYLVDNINRYTRCLKGALHDLGENKYYQETTKLGMSLEELGITGKTLAALKAYDIETAQQLVWFSANDIKAIRGIGERAFGFIEDMLYANGLSLRKGEDDEDW